MLFQLCKFCSKRVLSILALLEVFLIEVRDEDTQQSELFRQRLSAFDDVVREDIFLPVDPEVIEIFLSTVENLGQVGGPGAVLLVHLPVKHLVRICEVFAVGF